MSKKTSKSSALKSVINKSVLSKSTAGKSSTGKKRVMEESKSKTADNQQRPPDTIDNLIGGNSGYSGLPPPPPYYLDDDEAIKRYWEEQFTDVQRQSLSSLTGRIKDRYHTWKFVKEQLAQFESKEVNDQRKPPPLPKYDEKDYESTRKALSEYLRKLGDEVIKMEAELKQFQLMAKKKEALPTKADVAPKSVQIVQMSKRKPVKKQRPWVIILVAIGLLVLVALVVAAVLGVVFGSKSDDVKTRASKSVTIESVPGGQTGEASTNNGKSGGQGGSNTAPITTSSTAMSTTTTMPPPVNNYEIACKPQVDGGVSKECLVGSAPGSCSDNAVCWEMQFGISDMNGDIYKFTNNTAKPTFPPPSTDQKRMCKTDDGQLGSCDDINGQCNLDDRLIDKGLNERAEWKDNCDEPSPCWGESWMDKFGNDWQWKRDHCTTTGACPIAYTHAVIWMQHVRCHAGAERTANGTCQGLPLQLWVCKQCTEYSDLNLKQRHCNNQGWRPTTDPCILECGKGQSWTRKVAPDGFNCTAADGQPSLCYKGQCFPIAKDARIDPIPTLEECNQTREADKKIQAEFMRGRREAININDFTARINARSMSDDESPQTDALEKPTEIPIKSEDAKKSFDE